MKMLLPQAGAFLPNLSGVTSFMNDQVLSMGVVGFDCDYNEAQSVLFR